MSERGSFVSEYIYCKRCLLSVQKVLGKLGVRYTLVSMLGPRGGTKYLPIVAGEITGLYSGEELDVFQYEIIPELTKTVCHEIRISVLAERGEKIFRVIPIAKGEAK